MMNRLRRRLSPIIGRIRRARRRRYLSNLYDMNRKMFYARAPRVKIVSKLKVSIIVPAYNPKPVYFEHLLSSVFAQSYENWELVIADGSTNSSIQRFIERKSAADIRIQYLRVENRGIAANTNAAIQAATGELLAFLDHDDVLDPDALAYEVEQFQLFPATGLVYSDEDKIVEDGSRYLDPHYKPDFSLDLLRNVNYITHFVMVRTEVARAIGGIREGFEGAQDYDFLLRLVDTGIGVRHVPRILYHWRLSESSTAADFSNKTHIIRAGEKALEEHFERCGVNNVSVKAIKGRPGFYKPIHKITPKKRLILLALPGFTPESVKKFIKEKYLSNTSVHDNTIEVQEFSKNLELDEYETVMLVRGTAIPGFKKSKIIQLFLAAEQEDVFAVSPKLVSNGRIGDMGLVKGSSNRLIPLFSGMDPDDYNVFGSTEWVRNVNALGGPIVVMSGKDALRHMKKPTDIIELKKNDNSQRLVVWSHIEMLGLTDASVPQAVSEAQDILFNQNLTADYVPMVQSGIDVTALMEEKFEIEKYDE